MDPAIKGGFAIGFAALAVAAGLLGWSQGWLSLKDDRGASAPVAVLQAPGAAPSGESAPGTATPPSNGSRTTPGSESAGATPAPSAAPSGRTGGDPTSANLAASGASPPSSQGVLAALAPQATVPSKPSDTASPEKGVFDIVRVEPSGDLVAAGRCPAGCTVELTVNGRTIETAKADASGGFALTPPALPPGDHQLGLRVTGADGRQAVSEQTVTISIPARPSKDVVVVLNRPDAPSEILQQPGQASSAPKPPPPGPVGALASRQPGAAGATPAQAPSGVTLGAVDAENGRFFIQGAAPAGARLRVYLNNALIAEPVAGPDGRWSLRVERGLSPGRYVARIDQLDGAGKVASRAEQAFGYEAEVAAAPTAGASRPPEALGGAADAVGRMPPTVPQTARERDSNVRQSAPGLSAAPTAAARAVRPGEGDRGLGSDASSRTNGQALEAATSDATTRSGASQTATAAPNATAPDAANPVVASIDTAQVRRGDSLWRISRATYGRGQRYTIIFTANDGQIRNPDLIYPGQVLVLPSGRIGGTADARPTR